ncbi:MAG: sigma 54-interacting transcriptional regulator [Bacillota bacterium]|nr:sigma 54-interacting transcriptional regulator [Bacillota bacterium]
MLHDFKSVSLTNHSQSTDDNLKILKANSKTIGVTGIDLDNSNPKHTQNSLTDSKACYRTVSGSLNIAQQSQMQIHSPEFHDVLSQADVYRNHRDIPVVIEGATGTGKELIARYIHYGKDNYSNSPFVALNCAALTPTLIESELFGYEGGAFTGGKTNGQKGKLALAQGGTLFLDEILELDLQSQAKLLRVLEEKSYYQVGGLKLIKTDVRIIAASNQNLLSAVETGRFRADLYFRLGAAKIYVPPIRQRKGAILPLAMSFLQEFSKANEVNAYTFTEEAIQHLLSYTWPGNVRELRNVIQCAALKAKNGTIDLHHLGSLDQQKHIEISDAACTAESTLLDSSHFDLPPHSLDLDTLVANIITRALDMHRGNKSQTASYLGISRSSLYRRLAHIKHP